MKRNGHRLAQLLPEIEAYLTQHDVYQKLDGVVKELVQQMPEDPVAFLVQRLQVGAERWLEARIRWRGVDPSTSLPYPEQWVRDRDEHGLVMNGALPH